MFFDLGKRLKGLLQVLTYIITFFACMIGTVSGMGGGIIIKPVLDATGHMSVAAVTFLSGVAVIMMTIWTLGKTIVLRESVLSARNTTLLAISAAVGGLFGKQAYSMTVALFPTPNMAGGVQATLLLAATIATFIYSVHKERVYTKNVSSIAVIIAIGVVLGVLGSFMGIGGGPFNVVVLQYFFSMETKTATQNSLLIVLFSQLSSVLKTILFDSLPQFPLGILIGMIIVGILGSEVGRKINKKVNEHQAAYLLEAAMILIMGISVYNIYSFLG